jgi:hypothetical protein
MKIRNIAVLAVGVASLAACGHTESKSPAPTTTVTPVISDYESYQTPSGAWWLAKCSAGIPEESPETCYTRDSDAYYIYNVPGLASMAVPVCDSDFQTLCVTRDAGVGTMVKFVQD